MKEELKKRIVGHKLSSIIGVVGGAAISGAAGYYQASGGSLVDWKPYAIAAGVSVAGLLYKKN